MSVNLGFIDDYARCHMAEFLREADNDRLADEATGPRRRTLAVVAHWLRAIADRLEGGRRQRTATPVTWPTARA
jgi:hypothetical protein